MKYLKVLGLAAIAAAALMAFAGTASATTLTSPKGTALGVGAIIHAEAEGHAVLDPPIGKIECPSTVEGEITNAGGAGLPVTGKITTLTFPNCTNGAVVTVLAKGTLSISSSGSNSGSLSSTGAEVTVEAFGFHCIFKTNATPLGTVTGSTEPKANEFTDATLDISAEISRTGGRSGAFCGEKAKWTGSYKVTKPTPLFID
jgi:hypothetical protein